MFNYITLLRLRASNELKINRKLLPLKPPKGGSETLIRCFTSKTDILSTKLCYKPLDKALTQIAILCMILRIINAGR